MGFFSTSKRKKRKGVASCAASKKLAHSRSNGNDSFSCHFTPDRTISSQAVSVQSRLSDDERLADDDVLLPPSLQRRIGLPMLLRDFVESSSTIHSPPKGRTFPGGETPPKKSGNRTNVDAAKPLSLSAAAYAQSNCCKLDIPPDVPPIRSSNALLLSTSNGVHDKSMTPESVAVSKGTLCPSVHSEIDQYGGFDADDGVVVLEKEPEAGPFLWFTGAVSLSVLEHRQEAFLDHSHQSWDKLFVPAPQRMVRESCVRQLRCCLSSSCKKRSTSLLLSSGGGGPHAAAELLDPGQMNHADARSTMILRENVKAEERVVEELLQAGNYDGAIVIGRDMLKARRAKDKNPVAVSTLASQLALLCLAAGRNREASHYSAEAVKSLPTASTATTRLQAETAVRILLGHGLVQFGANKLGQAVKAWREAIHLAIAVKGYQDTTVAVLLNDIGVLHMETGDLKDSLRSFEESLELQRTILGNGSEVRRVGSADDAIYRLAITMGNLAMACEHHDRVDRAISLLDESMALYESVLVNTSEEEDIVQRHLERLIDNQSKRQPLGETALNSSEDYGSQLQDTSRSTHSVTLKSILNGSECLLDESESDGEVSVDSSRPMSLFGNSDGVPSRRVSAMLSMEQTDNHDFLLLGTLSPEVTAEDRVRETVLTWFNKRVDDDPVCTFDVRADSVGDDGDPSATRPSIFPSLSNHPTRCNESIPVDLDGEDVLNADLHLNEIHKQAMQHLDHNEIDDALELFRSALRSHRKKYGDVHHLVGSALHNIGMVLFFAKRYSMALATFEDAVVVRNEALGPDHPDVQSSLVKIAMLHLAMGNLHQAHDTFSELRDRLVLLGIGYGHPQLAKMINNVGAVTYELGDFATALESFKFAYTHQRRLLERQSLDECMHEFLSLAAANTLSNIAFVYSKCGDVEQALELYEHAYCVMRNYLPRHHHRVLEVRKTIDYLGATGEAHPFCYGNKRRLS